MTDTPLPPLRIAIAGLGTVGAGVIRLLDTNRDLITARAGRGIEVTAVSARVRGSNAKSRPRSAIAADGWSGGPTSPPELLVAP